MEKDVTNACKGLHESLFSSHCNKFTHTKRTSPSLALALVVLPMCFMTYTQPLLFMLQAIKPHAGPDWTGWLFRDSVTVRAVNGLQLEGH